MDKTPSPPLLPIFRSQQQAELLALILGSPTVEYTLAELAVRTEIPYASLHREIDRATAAGLIARHNIGRTILVQANTTSPYYSGLSDILTKAFGAPWILGQLLNGIAGITAAYIYGSWAARHAGENGDRPVGDIDLLVLGNPDRDHIYAAARTAEQRLGRPLQITIRSADWLAHGTGSFHDTVANRPLTEVPITPTDTTQEDPSPISARPRQRQPVPSRAPTTNRRH